MNEYFMIYNTDKDNDNSTISEDVPSVIILTNPTGPTVIITGPSVITKDASEDSDEEEALPTSVEGSIDFNGENGNEESSSNSDNSTETDSSLKHSSTDKLGKPENYKDKYSNIEVKKIVEGSFFYGDRKVTFQCPQCDYQTRWKADVRRHVVSIHFGGKHFSCKQCQYKASQKYHLTTHIKAVHGGVKLYKCKECDQNFGQHSTLKRHVLAIHKREKPFVCTKCTYQSSQQCNLKQHYLAVHTQERPFICFHCDYAAAKKDQLNNHISSKHCI